MDSDLFSQWYRGRDHRQRRERIVCRSSVLEKVQDELQRLAIILPWILLLPPWQRRLCFW